MANHENHSVWYKRHGWAGRSPRMSFRPRRRISPFGGPRLSSAKTRQTPRTHRPESRRSLRFRIATQRLRCLPIFARRVRRWSQRGRLSAHRLRLTARRGEFAAQTQSANDVYLCLRPWYRQRSKKGRIMWTRVKGRTENALLRLPFKALTCSRIGAVLPLYGIKSKTPLYNFFYAVGAPLMKLIRKFSPQYVETTEEVGKAMLITAKRGAPKPILRDLRHLLASELLIS